MAHGLGAEQKPVLVFYGVGGVGKTALLKRALSELSELKNKARATFGKLHTVYLDIDTNDITPSSSVFEVYKRLRLACVKAGVRTPLFDCLFFHYWRKDQGSKQTELRFEDELNLGTEVSDITASFVETLKETAGDVAGSFKLVGLANRALARVLDHRRQKKVGLMVGVVPDQMTPKELSDRFTEALASDIEDFLDSDSGRSVCVLIDGFERIQSRERREDAQRALQDLCARLVLNPAMRGRAGVVIAGRELLRWHDLYDAPHEADPWTNYVESQRVGGLAEHDAKRFIEEVAPPEYERADLTAEAARIREHGGAILKAAEEHGIAGPPSYLPYHLDLALELIYRQGAAFRPWMLGSTPAQLEERFLRYLGEHERAALQVLALALRFDQPLFEHLIVTGVIQGFTVQSFSDLIGPDHSYIVPDPTVEGAYRFHRHMQDALVASLRPRQEGARAVIEKLLEYYDEQAAFETLAGCSPSRLAAYARAMEVALTHGESELLSLDRVQHWYWRLENRFDKVYDTNLRLPYAKRHATLMEKALGPEHPDVARGLNNLALLYQAQGKYEEAEPLYQRSRAIREAALGPEHPDVAQSLNNLAVLYQTQGKYEEALPLYQRDLAISEKALGSEHPDVATSLNNLAELYRAQGKYEEAEPLYQWSLAIKEKALGPDHPHVATSLNNLAELYRAQGKYKEAEPLYQRSLAIREKALGPDHPHVTQSLNNLALLYGTQGKYEEAEPLYQRSWAIREKALGPDHPDVAQSLNNLALLYRTQGKYEKAEPLYQRSRTIRETALGPEHPDVAQSLNNLAVLYRAQGKYDEAEPLYQRSLAIWEEALGPEHPDVATGLTNLAELYQAQGRNADAAALFERALAMRERVFGPEHPLTLSLRHRARLPATEERGEVNPPSDTQGPSSD